MDVQVTFEPLARKVKVRSGTTVLQAARRAGVAIVTRCGGNASCFMCKVHIEDWTGLAPMKENERRKLSGLEQTGTRLACQTVLQEGQVVIQLPPDPLRAAIAKQLAQRQEEDTLW
ncbi:MULTISPECIES: 2Fe-2S iron-sulfur cluster-binding protein [Paenibacillus]|uniref:2Fe-2S iron-sulfur cluster-binding protein n=1 Tax=Paenibacillus TaxID=44249 RepID=UPI00203CD15C|nr:2Fe-2S iron-sulfur cluster-binding protein [Paenibacillus camelliae]MCM3633077.1 2Fe-2S iron-sulfur cluster-binding protein [Paenibacillus camelliae]